MKRRRESFRQISEWGLTKVFAILIPSVVLCVGVHFLLGNIPANLGSNVSMMPGIICVFFAIGFGAYSIPVGLRLDHVIVDGDWIFVNNAFRSAQFPVKDLWFVELADQKGSVRMLFRNKQGEFQNSYFVPVRVRKITWWSFGEIFEELDSIAESNRARERRDIWGQPL